MPPPYGRWRPAAVLVAATVTAGLVVGLAGRGTTAGPPSHLPLGARSDLANRAATIIEAANLTSGAVLRTHGSDRPAVCVTEVFGVDPATAASAREVSTAYVWAVCAERLPCHQQGASVDVPVVVHLGNQPWIEVAADDENAREVSRLFPDGLAGPAQAGPPDTDALMARLIAITGPLPVADQPVGC